MYAPAEVVHMSPSTGDVGAVPWGRRTEAAEAVGRSVVNLPVVSIWTCAEDAPPAAKRIIPDVGLFRIQMCPAALL